MNDNRESSEALRQLLHEWRVESTAPPQFAEGVWRRIEREQRNSESPWKALVGWFALRLARPAFAGAFVATLLGTGLAVGVFQAQHKVEHASAAQRSSYLRSVNPYFAAAQNPAAP